MIFPTGTLNWSRKRRERWKATSSRPFVSASSVILVIVSLLFCSISVSARPFLIFSNQKDIRLAEVSNRRSHTKTMVVVKNLRDAAALDVILSENKVCWTEIKKQAISCLTIGPENEDEMNDPEIIANADVINPEGIACDWVSSKVYWTDSTTKKIEVASLTSKRETRDRKVLVWEELDMPRAIVLAPHDGYMFWTDWGAIPRIERASMDGDPKSRVTLVENNIRWPNGLTLDYEHRRMFWIDGNLHTINVADWNGKHQRKLNVDPADLPQPFAIAYHDFELFWTDWHTGSMHMLNTTQSLETMTRPEKIRFARSRRDRIDPMDIKVYELGRQPIIKDNPLECLKDNGGCSHLCLISSTASNGYACACPTGHKMIDSKTCYDDYEEILLLARRTDLRKMSLDTPDFTDITIKLNSSYSREVISAIAIDYDPVEKYVFWTDQNQGIFRSYLNGSHFENIVSVEIYNAGGLAVDWVSRNLFWTDTGVDQISVSKLDGSSRRVLVSGDMDEPRAIVIDPVNGWMYWTDWGENPKIERAWLDGTHRGKIVSSDLGWPNGLALDQEEQLLYWCDANLDKIEVAKTDGSDRKLLIASDVPHPYGLTLLGDYIYWTDWQENVVQRAKKKDGKDKKVLMTHLTDLMDVHAAKTSPNDAISNPCQDSNGGCSHLCLVTPEGVKCQCPDERGYELDTSGKKCILPEAVILYSRKNVLGRLSVTPRSQNNYVLPIRGINEVSAVSFNKWDEKLYWTDIKDKTISRSFMNGTDTEIIIDSGLGICDGLAVDWNANNIYWTDMSAGRIEVARTNGTSRRVLIWKHLDKPSSIALYPEEGKMFWSTWGDRPAIEVAGLDGKARNVFVEKVGRSNSLTIDFLNHRLYWSDLDGKMISFTYLKINRLEDSRAKEIQNIIGNSPMPYSMTLFNNFVYWTDWTFQKVLRADKNTGQNQELVRANISDIMDLAILHESRQAGSNPCKNQNGQCSHLCLFAHGEAKCACPSQYRISPDNLSECLPPKDFILYSQRNKISRLVMIDEEVPDVVLPVHGGRDIHSMTYDALTRSIFWIDYGSKRKEKISIKQAFDNGPLLGRLIHGEKGSSFEPFDIAMDPVSRHIFWTCQLTGSINVTKVDGDDAGLTIGTIVSGGSPKNIAVHPKMSLIFWSGTDGLSWFIEKAHLDGHNRKVLVSNTEANITDIAVDDEDNLIFWSDSLRRTIQRCDIEGGNIQVLVAYGSEGNFISRPKAIAVHGSHVYWADDELDGVFRVNKKDGRKPEQVLSGIKHISSLIAVSSSDFRLEEGPCVNAPCSHLCLVDESGRGYKCSCPVGSGLVLNADESTCGLPPTCKPEEFTCTKGSPTCIPLQWRCDGQTECSDHSDEMDCPECGANTFRCGDGTCVSSSAICDDKKDCIDGSDENNCCTKDEFRCLVTGECIPREKLCDRVKDCSDDSDEYAEQCNNDIIDQSALNQSPSTATADPGSSESSSLIVVVSVVVALFFVIVAVMLVIIYIRRRNKIQKEENIQPSNTTSYTGVPVVGGSNRFPAVGAETKLFGSLTRVSVSVSNKHIEPECVTTIPEEGISHVGGSSNGMIYDRSHVTGASSSTTSASPTPAPMPSPTTTVRMFRSSNAMTGSLGRPSSSRCAPPPPSSTYSRYHTTRPSHHHSHHSHQFHQHPHHQQHHLHLPTPVSTDINEEESDVYESTAFRPAPPARQHYPSAANSTYEDSDVYGNMLLIQDKTAGTPDSPVNERAYFLNNASVLPEPPPPSRVPSPTFDISNNS